MAVSAHQAERQAQEAVDDAIAAWKAHRDACGTCKPYAGSKIIDGCPEARKLSRDVWEAMHVARIEYRRRCKARKRRGRR
jgi:hypothetical protein